MSLLGRENWPICRFLRLICQRSAIEISIIWANKSGFIWKATTAPIQYVRFQQPAEAFVISGFVEEFFISKHT